MTVTPNITGEEVTDSGVNVFHRSAIGAIGPTYADTPVCCASLPSCPHTCIEGEGLGEYDVDTVADVVLDAVEDVVGVAEGVGVGLASAYTLKSSEPMITVPSLQIAGEERMGPVAVNDHATVGARNGAPVSAVTV